MTIDYYGVKNSPPCRLVLLVAKKLNIQLNHKPFDFFNGEHRKPEFLKINPAHCIPTIIDNGFVLWESRAIVQYLCNKYAPDSDLYPKDPKDRANVDRMLNFDMTLFGLARKYQGRLMGYELTEAELKTLKDTLQLLDTLIGGNGNVALKQLTLADIAIFATMVILHLHDYDFSEYSNVKQWFDRITDELSYFDEINGKEKEEYMTIIQNMVKKHMMQKSPPK